MSRISPVDQKTTVFARQLTLSGVTYSTDTSAIGNTYAFGASTGNDVTYTFTGTGVRIYSVTNSNQGIVDVFLDGILAESVDTYSAGLTYNVLIYENTSLAAGSHTIKIEVSGNKNASSTDIVMRIEAIEYWGAGRTAATRSAASSRSANAAARSAPSVIVSNNWFACSAVAPNGRVYGAGRIPLTHAILDNAAYNHLFRSSLNGDNFRKVYATGGTDAAKAIKSVYVADTGTVFISLWNGTVWRSTDEGITFTSVLTMGGTDRFAFSWSWGEYQGTILVGEYGAVAYPMKVYASTDDGITWSTVFNSQTKMGANATHIHLVMIDPTNGDWYVTTGDGAAVNNNFRSTNRGSTWTSISAVIGYLGAAFYDGYVLFLRETRIVYKYVKSTGGITEVGTIGSVGNGYRMIKNNDGNLIATVYTTAAGTINAAFGIWKSTDEGATWSQIHSGKEGFDLLAPKLDADGYAWATISSGHQILKLYPAVRAK